MPSLSHVYNVFVPKGCRLMRLDKPAHLPSVRPSDRSTFEQCHACVRLCPIPADCIREY